MLTFNKLKFKDVKTKDFGEEITIRVNAESIKHFSRKVQLQDKIKAMKLSDEDSLAYNVAANLMSICTYPATSEYCFDPEQMDNIVNDISIDLFTNLSVANKEVNPGQFLETEQKTLQAKKKST
jgi:hypothetical protein